MAQKVKPKTKKKSKAKSAGPKKPATSKKREPNAKSDAGSLEGKRAPSFSVATDKGQTISLSKLRGKNVVLYFYPKDNTPGCTTEGLDFTKLLPSFSRQNAVVIGVSKDSTDSHKKFRDKQGLKIELGSDPDGSICNAFGVWKKKSLYGRTFMGIERSTFLIDAKGKIVREWRKVKVAGHAQAVLDALKDAA